jgi:hypothetical protein
MLLILIAKKIYSTYSLSHKWGACRKGVTNGLTCTDDVTVKLNKLFRSYMYI